MKNYSQAVQRPIWGKLFKIGKVIKNLTNQKKIISMKKFYKNIGYVIRIQDYRDSLYRYLHHAVSILVQFDPPENEEIPDGMLTFDSYFAE